MALRSDELWFWDFWLAHDGARHHLFVLQAPRSLGDPDQRHWHATIGHYTSADLTTWTRRPDALAPAPPGAWDDGTVWTGSVLRALDRWWLFYTGTTTAERCLVQRIGAAVSDDLDTWTRVGDGPLVETDTRWYETLDPSWHDQAWRDPHVFAHDGRFHMLLTARRHDGPADARGVVAHAVSDDLVHWDVGPPVNASRLHGQLEVPQMVPFGGGAVLLCSVGATTFAAGFEQEMGRPPMSGTFAWWGPGPLGPFELVDPEPIGGNQLYSGKLVAHDGRLRYLAFRAGEGDAFVGEITDPIPARILPSGRVVLERGRPVGA